MGRVVLVEVLLKHAGVVEALRLEDVGDVAADKDNNRMTVFAYLGICLVIHVGGVTRTPNWRWRSREISRLASRTPTPWPGW